MKRLSTLLILMNVFVFGVQEAQATKSKTVNDTTYVFLKEYGLYKTRKRNAVKFVNRAIADLDNVGGANHKVLLFTPGTYHFYPEGCETRVYYESNTTDVNPKVCAFLLEGKKNITIDGRGSRLIFHGQMQPFTFDNCSNITLKNVKIDWEQPLTAQAEVLRVNDNYIDLAINLKESPYRTENGKLLFVKARHEFNPWKSAMEFDREGRYVVPQTGDNGCLGPGWEDYLAETTMPGIVRLHHTFMRKPAVGNFLVLRHAERVHAGVFIKGSKNITIKNLDLYHATGLGILAQFSENLTFDGYRAVPNRLKNRYFGGGDDGIQVSNCRGQVTIANCEFEGLMDDPVNVHGTSVQVQEIVSPTQLKCRFMHHQSVGLDWGHPGDRISFIENERMNSMGTGEVAAFQPIDNETFTVTFKSGVPDGLEVGDALENLTWSPDLLVKDSHFKNCRARGLLVSTPGKVVIENNIFESSGSAILIAGDANGWFESGAVTDVLIRNNVFTDLCNTAPYQFCEGIISVFPIIPKLDGETPPFHRNIRIEGNEFNPFDYPVLFARSVGGLTFKNNKVTRSTRFEPYHRRKYTFSFESCKGVEISGNTFSDDLLGKNILLRGTAKTELDTDLGDSFTISED